MVVSKRAFPLQRWLSFELQSHAQRYDLIALTKMMMEAVKTSEIPSV
jgi:hypothetical protein